MRRELQRLGTAPATAQFPALALGFAVEMMSATPNNLQPDPFEEDVDYDPLLDPDWCDECQGEGRVPTRDYESYFGADYKPCPKCGGDPCIGEPPIS